MTEADAYYDSAERQIERLHNEIEVMQAAMIECSHRLGGLSMGTEGHMRAEICKANNFLLKALNRPLQSVAQVWQENDPEYMRLIGDAVALMRWHQRRGNE